MKLLHALLTLSLLIPLLPTNAIAGFAEGLAAAKKGDFVTAVRLYRLAADQGDASAQSNLGTMYVNGQGVTQDYKEAVRLYRLAADQGDDGAQYNLGLMYFKGQGVAQDDKEAARFYRLAADQGNARAQYNLGVMYFKGQGVTQDYKEALRLYRLAADQGDASAQSNLGLMYFNGQGVAQDYKEAVRLYRLAADQGHANAQYNLGLMYFNGQGVAQDYKEAVRLYRLAADQGDDGAQYNLGVRYANGQGVAQDYKEAVRLFRLAADQGHAIAQYNLGVMYFNGQGVAQDYKEAVRLFRLAADQGDARAQSNLGLMYFNGQGVAQDYKEAVRLFRLAADQGTARAQSNLGLMYFNGQGVAQDYKEAVRLYRLAADQGDDGAQYNLGLMYANGQGVAQDYKEAVRLFRLAADQGDDGAQYGLGLMYANGQGVAQDDKEAVRLYRLAADQGHANAQSNLGGMYESGRGVLVSRVTAYALYNLSAAGDPSSDNKATANRTGLAKSMNNKEIEAAQDLTRELSKPKNFLKALDQYSKNPAIKAKAKAKAKPVAANDDRDDEPTAVASNDPYPARPAKTPGVVSCNTRCVNASLAFQGNEVQMCMNFEYAYSFHLTDKSKSLEENKRMGLEYGRTFMPIYRAGFLELPNLQIDLPEILASAQIVGENLFKTKSKSALIDEVNKCRAKFGAERIVVESEVRHPVPKSDLPSVRIVPTPTPTPAEVQPMENSAKPASSAFISNHSPPVPEFTDTESRLYYLRWLGTMSAGMKATLPDWNARREFLQTVWYEARRADLEPSLVLALIENVSNFRKFYVSENGARGYMSVMPFWASELGDGDMGKLFHMQTNLRFGCVILRHYLNQRKGVLFLALSDYYKINVLIESQQKSESEFPNLVLGRMRHWDTLPVGSPF